MADVVLDGHTHVGVELSMYLQGHYPYAQMVPQLVADGGSLGVTHWVVFPMVTNLAMSIAGLRRGEVSDDGAVEQVPYAFENRRLLDEINGMFAQHSPCLFPFVMLDPVRCTDAQADALRELRAEHRFFGFKIQPTMIRAEIKGLLGPGRVFLELAEEWSLPFLIHSSVFPDDPWSRTSDILEIVDQYPAINFCLAHSCRFDKGALDRVASLPNAWFDCSAHVIHCRIAAMGSPHVAPPASRFPSDYEQPARVLADLAEAYPDKLIWASDAPYHSFAAPDAEGLSLFSTYADEVACLRTLPPGLQSKVAADNGMRCFGLGQVGLG